MAFLFKKVIKPWNSQNPRTQDEQPVSPPPPDLSHLTADEISVINDVIRRQEEFDRLEADRIRKIKDDLDHLQDKLVQSSSVKNQQRKEIDLRLCRLCFKNKFADGVGRVCSDCQQRVCSQCGSFTKTKWSSRRNKNMRGRWRCKLCFARREALCKTGGWYHAEEHSLDLTEDLKMRLTSAYDGDTDAGSSMYQEYDTTNIEDSDLCLSANRSDSELLQQATFALTSRRPSAVKYTRRKSLPPESMNGEERLSRKCRGHGEKKQDGFADGDDDDEDDDEESFDSLVLQRKMSRRRRQEKKQRRRWRNGQEASFENSMENHLASAGKTPVEQKRDYSIEYLASGQGSQRDNTTRALWGPSNSLGKRQPSPAPLEDNAANRSSTTENSSVVSSFRDSSDGGLSSPSPIPSTLRIIRQDAISLGSSCISISSTGDVTGSRRGDLNVAGATSSHEKLSAISRDSSSTHSFKAKDVKHTQLQGMEASYSNQGDLALTRWKKKGYKHVYMVVMPSYTRDRPYSIGVVGGNLCSKYASKAIVQWVSSELRSRLALGHEILEWNDQCLKDKSFDQVTSVTSSSPSQTVLVVNPLGWPDSGQTMNDEHTGCVSDRPSSCSPSIDAQNKGSKRRMLPRTPVEIKRGIRQVHGEILVQLHYQVMSACLTVIIKRAKDLSQASELMDQYLPSPFALVHITPRRSLRESMETEIRTATNKPEWEQAFPIESLSLTELTHKSLELSVWSYEERGDVFLGEVLIDLNEADLNKKSVWYQLQEHDDNNSPLPQRRRNLLISMSESLTSGSFHFISPAVSPEVPFHRQHTHSPSIVSATASPVPFRASRVGSKEFHLNSASQPDSFTTKVRKKMRDTVNKMSSLSLSERRDVTGSDESPQMDGQRRPSLKSDRKSPSSAKRKQNSKEHASMDLLAPPHPPSRTNSSSSFFWSEDEDSRSRYSVSSSIPDRPPPEGDDITSILGPGQIPPKPSAEATVCGDIKLGFMVSKGQLEVDIICAADLHRSGHSQAPDTYVKTYLVEGRKVIQRKKILTVKGSFDPVYRKKIKYSACNVHGRIMKIDIWERTGSFEKKVCRGEVLVRLDHLDLSTHTMAWYKLFQINATDYGSDEFLNNW